MRHPLFTLSALLLIFCFPSEHMAQPEVILESYATGFSSPVGIYNAGDDRLFIVERRGRIRVLDSEGNTQPTFFLDIDARVHNTGGQSEQGLLGLAFHPDFKNNGYFYVNYTGNDDDTRISRFSVSPGDSSVADPNSEVILMTINQPFGNHNAGDLSFGPDGYLYIGTGDGGSANDPGNRSQDPENLLGKMLRIDVDNGSPYAIPSDNPFVNDTTILDEIWAIGLRNPWRHSFDRLTGDFWISDVGQGRYEEVNFQTANSMGGENYGWRCYEGSAAFNTSGCGNINDYTMPVAEYFHNGFEHCSITGGYVYRGTKYPSFEGYYIFADYCSGRFWATSPDGNGGWQTDIVADGRELPGISAFGEDASGELYAANLNNGRIYRVTVDQCSSISIDVTVTEVSCNGGSDGSIEVEVTTDADDYQLSWTPPLDSLNGLSAGNYILTYTDENDCNIEETVELAEPIAVALLGTFITYDGDSLELTLFITPSPEYFQWTLNGELIPGARDTVYFPTQSGEYSLIFFDENGCKTYLAQTVNVVLTSIDWPQGFEQFNVRPSLFRESLIIDLQTNRPVPVQLKLINNNGQVLRETATTLNGPFQQIWTTEDLVAGIYFVQVLSPEGSMTEKVVKLK